MTLKPTHTRVGTARKGYVLFAVLLVTVVLSLTAYRFTDSMVTENTVAVRSTEQIQARMSAVSGIYYAAGHLADPATLGTDVSDNADLFSGQVVGPRGRFSLINVSEALDGSGTGESRYTPRYGIIDEGGKINVNALIQQDGTGTLLVTALQSLPNMTPEIADAIANWVMASGSVRPLGGQDAAYEGAATPYLRKKGPLNSVDELLLVEGVTPLLLFGNDRNRNGKLDAGEDDGNEFGRGWSEYLTCYGREINVDSSGQPRVNLLKTDLKTLSEKLNTALKDQGVSDYVLYSIVTGRSGTPGVRTFSPTLAANQEPGSVADLRDLVQKAIDAGAAPKLKNAASVLTFWNTQIVLSPKTMPVQPGERPVPAKQPVIPSPLNDPATLAKVLPILLDQFTVEDGYELLPRINVNTAPAQVLRALIQVAVNFKMNITVEEGEAYITGRADLDPSTPEVSTGAWLVTQAQMKPEIFKLLLENKLISGRSWTYRVHSVGYSGLAEGQEPGTSSRRGPVARVEAVIDVGTRTTDSPPVGLPRIVYFRDLTDLGRGFADLPGSQ